MKEQFANEMNVMKESLEQAHETAKYERLKNNVLEEHVNKLTQDMEAKNKLVEELMLQINELKAKVDQDELGVCQALDRIAFALGVAEL